MLVTHKIWSFEHNQGLIKSDHENHHYYLSSDRLSPSLCDWGQWGILGKLWRTMKQHIIGFSGGRGDHWHHQAGPGPGPGTVLFVTDFAKSWVLQYMNKVWEELCTGDCSISFNPGSQLDRELLQQSRLITQKMDVLEESLASVQSSVSSLHRTLPTYVRYEIKLDRLEQIISNIWGTYNLLEFYQVNHGTISNSEDKASF